MVKSKSSEARQEIIEDLTQRKKRSCEFLRSLLPEEKIAKLVELQERYYQILKARAEWRSKNSRTMAKMVQGAL